jgi:hypothetical protein
MRPKKESTAMSLMVLRLDVWGTPESNNIAGVYYLIEFQEASMNEYSYLGDHDRTCTARVTRS